MDKKNISFLFGAGAEANSKSEEESFGLPSGTEFLEETLYKNKSSNDFKNALKASFRDKYFGFYTYSKYHINTDIYKFMLEKIIRKNCVDSQMSIKDTDDLLKKSREQNVLDEFKEILKSDKSYNDIKNQFLKDILKEYKNDMKSLGDVGSAGLLDSYFYTIINPPKYSKVNFSRIFNYYWGCYFAIVENILKTLYEKNILDNQIDEFYKDGKLLYKEIISKIDTFTKTLYSYKPKILSSYSASYYARIKDFLNEHSSEFELKGIATTNYFLFSEILSDSAEKTAYLNGKLSLFEYPELLEVRDFSEETPTENKFDTKHIFFPFIFGQSHLKPVVDKKQTEEFHKFGKILDASNILVILGYNINEDDNHVNSFLHNYLTNPENHLAFVTNYADKNDVCRKLKAENLQGQIKIIKADYEKQTTSEIVENIFSKLK